MVYVTNQSELVLLLNAVHQEGLRIIRDTKEKSKKRSIQAITYRVTNRSIIEMIKGPWFH